MNVHFRHIVLSIVASVLFAACQDTDVPTAPEDNETQGVTTAYLSVNLALSDGGKLSRAVDDGYQDGVLEDFYYYKDENRIVSYDDYRIKVADFYLFDKNGKFTHHIHKSAEQLTTTNPANGGTKDNIESIVIPISSYGKIAVDKESSIQEFIDQEASYILVTLNENGNFKREIIDKCPSDKNHLDHIAESKARDVDMQYSIYGPNRTDENGNGDYTSIISYSFMINSSYRGGDHNGEHINSKNWVVPITTANLKSSSVEAQANPLEIYVERRGGKLSVELPKEGNNVYDVDFCVGGVHEADLYDSNPGYIIKAMKGTEEKEIVMQFYEWCPNATEKQCYYVKNIEGNWSDNNSKWLNTLTNWNKPDSHRSHWAKSSNYASYAAGNYATSFEDWATQSKTYTNSQGGQNTDDDYKLHYYSLQDLINGMGVAYRQAKYTLEHTPNIDQIKARKERMTINHWLLTARVYGYWEDWTDGKGTSYKKDKMPKPFGETTNGIINMTFFRWADRIWSEKDLVAQLLSSYQAQYGGFNAYTKSVVDGKDVYNQIELKHFRFVDHFDGTVKLGLNDDATLKVYFPGMKDGEIVYNIKGDGINEVKRGQEWYYKKSDGNYEKYEIEADTTLTLGKLVEADRNTGIKTIAQQIDDFNRSTVIPMGINGYKDGYMYYSIPIEHLGNSGQEQEGDYGVVGNHWYNLQIKAVSSLGWGIFDPYEDIIPNEKNRDFYGLSFKMQVCPWHVKEYDITLDGTTN